MCVSLCEVVKLSIDEVDVCVSETTKIMVCVCAQYLSSTAMKTMRRSIAAAANTSTTSSLVKQRKSVRKSTCSSHESNGRVRLMICRQSIPIVIYSKCPHRHQHVTYSKVIKSIFLKSGFIFIFL